MPDLKLTAARVDVLKGVAAGEVTHRRNWGHDPDEDVWKPGGYGRKRVNAAIKALADAKLIYQGAPVGPSMYASRPWRLTAAGEQWLAQHEQESGR